MGLTTWRPCEEQYLHERFTADTARSILKEGKGVFVRVAAVITEEYQERFHAPFTQESAAEFAARLSGIRRAKRRDALTPYLAEDAEQCKARLEGVGEVCIDRSSRTHTDPLLL